MKLVRRFSRALQLVEKVNDEAAAEVSIAPRGAFHATHPGSAVLSGVNEHDMLLYMEAAAASTRGWKQNSISNSRAFYSYTVLVL